MGNTTARTGIAAAAMCAVLAPAVPASAATVPATMIVLDRSGGFAGRHDTFVVDRMTAGGQRPLRLAARPAFRRLRASYEPANPCCDRFAYRIDVTYRNGRHKTVSTVQGTEAPPILWEVIDEVEQVAARPAAS